jgi:hypothetical protein
MITLHEDTISSIRNEMESIPLKYQKPFNSNHEGLAILQEEVIELQNEIFFGEKPLYQQVVTGILSNDVAKLSDEVISQEVTRAHRARIRKEAVQVAAMACRIIQELT